MTTTPTSAGSAGLIDRVRNIILTPSAEWDRIAGEQPSMGAIITGYIVPLAAVAAVAGALGLLLLSGFIGFGAGIVGILIGIVINVALAVGGVFLISLLINALAPTFGSQADAGRAFQLAAYFPTPIWIAMVATIVPVLGQLVVIAGAIYAIYEMYVGLPRLMKTPEDKRVAYVATIVIILMLIGVVIWYVVIGMILHGAMMGALAISPPK